MHESQNNIDGYFLDGASITYGNTPRKHIWVYTIYHLLLTAFLLLSAILYFMRMRITPGKAHAYSAVQLAG